MALELVAARVLSPYVGSSNQVWTSIIGVILISMSLGYWFGGKLADVKPSFKVLSGIIVASGIFVSVIPILETKLIKILALTNLRLEIVAIMSTLITFAVPSILLATVSPYAIKLMETKETNVGRIAGKLSAISTWGSIFGTFFTGFFLIPLVGTKMIVLISSILLILLSAFLFFEKDKKQIAFLTGCIVLSVLNVSVGAVYFKVDNPNILADIDSEYSRIWVMKEGEYKVLRVDRAIESYLNQEGKMGSYLNFYDLFDGYNPDAKDMLIIGGAAYTYPMHFLDKFKDKNIDVVEIDPAMTNIAKKYFGLKDDERLNIYHQDGRSFINKSEKKYDAIFVDAFKGHNVPFELTTVEAYSKMKEMLNEKGCVMVNVISAIEGEKSGFIKQEFSTFKEVFEDVKVFDVDNTNEGEIRNLILVGFNYKVGEVKSDEYTDMLAKEIKGFESGKSSFTDDYAPVEQYCI